MKSNKTFFKNFKSLPVDEFFKNVLYDKKFGYYSSKNPFGKLGDFLTAPGISNLFSEIISIWFVSSWLALDKPKNFNIVEMGPGDGLLIKILIKTFKNFPAFNKATNIFLYEKSSYLKKIQKKNIKDSKIKWIDNLKHIKKGPVIFFGNEFFDAIPIKQFSREKNNYLEKFFQLNKNNNINEVFKKAQINDINQINKFKSLKKLKFIEFPKLGLDELNKIIKIVSQLSGGVLLIDYGYLKPKNVSTIQSLKNHKQNNILKNLGHADITSLVNFDLLKEHFEKNNLKVANIVTQKFFLEKMGIMERANIISKKMTFKEQTNLYLRLKRLLDQKLMGKLFKVIFAYKHKKDNFIGFK